MRGTLSDAPKASDFTALSPTELGMSSPTFWRGVTSVFRIIAEWAVHAELRQAAAEPEDEDDEDDEGESEGEDEDE